ncbi:MAG: hypothetical protein Q8P28_08625 [Deltaproteobacteria bacterium]|nr:hypothetical protein [Deltaproteobacteria bacterium]
MKHIYLLGAGFTRAVMGAKAPLTDEIMPKLNLSGFPEIIEDYEKTFPDIEQFITQLDLKCLRFDKKNESLSKRHNEIRDNLVEQIVSMFDVNSLFIDSLDKFKTLKAFIDSVPVYSTILTLNYDCVLDQGLYLSKRWDPSDGYYVKALFPGEEGAEENKKLDNILLLKLHGSCNFRDSAGTPELFNIELTNKIFSGFHTESNDPNTSLDKGAHVLVMSYLKIYHKGIMKLWKKAIEVLKDADKLTIIGCSLREEDIFLQFALYHFGRRDNVEELFIEIVDVNKDTCENIESKVNRLCAWPNKHKIMQYSDGLEGYLSV